LLSCSRKDETTPNLEREKDSEEYEKGRKRKKRKGDK
jgi:hypothetical protein